MKIFTLFLFSLVVGIAFGQLEQESAVIEKSNIPTTQYEPISIEIIPVTIKITKTKTQLITTKTYPNMVIIKTEQKEE